MVTTIVFPIIFHFLYLYFFNFWIQDEIRLLHQKVKESELAAEKDRFLRDKISDDMANLVQENAALSQNKLEIAKQLERVRHITKKYKWVDTWSKNGHKKF